MKSEIKFASRLDIKDIVFHLPHYLDHKKDKKKIDEFFSDILSFAKKHSVFLYLENDCYGAWASPDDLLPYFEKYPYLRNLLDIGHLNRAMHAGFVNGAGILLALFSTLMFASNTLNVLFIIGGLTAIIAQFTKLLQVNVKQKLACSTIAQMGFMIMQCGLGFFNAAVVHLILHGFYKAYLFLASGEAIEHSKPQKQLGKIYFRYSC